MQSDFERAIRAGDAGLTEALLKSGTPVDARDRHGQTALMIAAHGGQLAVVECLLRHGANLDLTAKHGLSALMLAIVAGHEPVARTLVQAGADLTLRGSGAPGFHGKSAHDLTLQGGMETLRSEIAARETDGG
jgi:ankyrin repeat protein